MLLVGRIFAAVAGLLHVYIFMMESVLWMKPSVHRRFGVKDLALAQAMKGVFLNQGFYNLFLAVGALFGAFCFESFSSSAPAVLVFSCGSIVGAGLVLLFSAGKPMARAALIQALPPAITLLCLFFQDRF